MTKVKGSLRPTQYQAASSHEEVEDLIKELGEKRREIVRIEATMNDKVADIKHEHEMQAQPIKDDIEQIIYAVQAFAEVNRSELTNNGKTKTVKFATGEFAWRARPPKVSLRGKPKILDALKKLGLQRFIRTSEEIDKEALLKEKDVATQVTGITISSAGEDFAINPYELEIEGKQ
ncbi:hypothetical protein AVO42_00340 [Thiomicrospira sp. XS5]|uniref:host-nuclease inhibitor Gam family protein n=1 Tax=Thiomicrospira sp. XS5 TaxID=1775636 RepID=UPI0007490A92|nr:host-nuclease inhibitor Gam family protein [Thiomicrospira sp. XS5]KUJ73904.1 hypothetical protein AVO42_00340 [Thiomicrospira sp. XS5]